MIRSSRAGWTLGILSLILVLAACGSQVPTAESNPQLAAVETVSTPAPSAQAPVMPAPTPIAGEPVPTVEFPRKMVATGQVLTLSPPDPASTARPASTTTLRTSEPAPQALPDVFPIYPLPSPNSPTPTGARSPEDYQQAVITAVTLDLVRRIEEPLEGIHLVSADYLEVQLASPCGSGSAKEAADPSAGGLSLGFEVLLDAGGARHRYIGFGGLAYYCSLQ